MSDLTPYQAECLERTVSALERIANALESIDKSKKLDPGVQKLRG
jgi:hypothetical protein